MVICKVLLAVSVIIETLCIPLYLKAFWPKPNKKSLCLKMVCSTAFLSAGVLSSFISDNFSEYAVRILVALALGWIGDLFLHALGSMVLFIIGGAFFMVGHIEYIIVFIKTSLAIDSNTPVVTVPEIFALLVMSLIFGIIMIKKFQFRNIFIKIVTFLYGFFLITMLIKACRLGALCLVSGNEYGIFAFIWLILGGLMFFASDFTLGIMLLGGHNENRKLKAFNIITYFGAQMLFATTILFINA